MKIAWICDEHIERIIRDVVVYLKKNGLRSHSFLSKLDNFFLMSRKTQLLNHKLIPDPQIPFQQVFYNSSNIFSRSFLVRKRMLLEMV